ncbi:GNAT family N-acetyltransferase [Rhodoferax sediminis]|uniref:GNAT family N-acetyltransferase n=1 Tax=Rhodoferax sediminis TaxID=2509614 RepID=A0A515DAG1_9BURK|nr:GNAT family N-acetyltransferase [Rhodoferax sediminis]QDL37385.1 GNAT family N-acetyltransferase [Rhodoferax sediminis]
MLVLEPSLANFVRLAGVGGHQLLYHPASKTDIDRDKNTQRRARTLARLQQYTKLEGAPASPRNTAQTSANDACDNDILHALECSAVHALVTEDKEIHTKARQAGFGHQVYNIQTAEDWLRRLHEPAEVHLPNIEDVPMYSLTNQLNSTLFDSLRASYDTPQRSFDAWFREKARTGRNAWIARVDQGAVEAICIYALQTDEVINDAKDRLQGLSLKLCTFKVGEQIRGRKIGELFLKAAFRFATDSRCENIFVHTSDDQFYLLDLLRDFGFEKRGMYGTDIMLVKAHPSSPPNVDIPAIDYARLYFPHYRKDFTVRKFLVPIQPQYHQILFPDLARQAQLFGSSSVAGNAIKQAYLCKAPTNQVQPGDIVLFYRTGDERAVTTIGIVERYEVHENATNIIQIVSRRTVYSQKDIEAMTSTPIKVMLFRVAGHFQSPISYSSLRQENVVSGAIQSITKISDDSFSRLLRLSQG